MKIGIDGYFLCGKVTGMGVVLENIISRWPLNKFDKTYLFLPEKLSDALANKLEQRGIELIIYKKQNFFLWEQITIPRMIDKYNIDLIWFPFNTGSIFTRCDKIVTVHDLIYMKGSLLDQPTLYKKMGKIYRRIIVPRIMKSSKSIITISETACNEIIKKFPEYKSKINIIYNGCSYSNKYLTDDQWSKFAEKNSIDEDFILGFGSLEKRKNTLRLVRAFYENIDNMKNIKLILYGFRGYEDSEVFRFINNKGINKRIIVLGYISEEEKNTLYAKSKMFIFPSLEEGFGIPILEAFYNKTIVVTSNISSMPEIAGNGAIYIEPNNENSIYQGISNALSLKNKNELIDIGYNRCSKFTWDNAVKRYIEIFEKNKIY